MISLGCFFELAELEPPLGGIGGSGGNAGVTAGDAGETPIGGDSGGGNGGTAPFDCGAGQKYCGSGCVPIDPDNGCNDEACVPCVKPPNASLTCDGETGLCKVDSCDVGFADCDGDTSNYTAQAVGTGCEYDFSQGSDIRPAPVQPLEVPRGHIDIGDGSRDDWQGIPAYPLQETCNNCRDDTLFAIAAQNEVPPRRDLDAYFRVAWNNDFFYVLGDVFDDRVVSNGADNTTDGRCQTGALCEDAFYVFFDGRNNRSVNDGYGIDDPRVFIGSSSTSFRVSGENVGPPVIDLKAVQNGACYRIEAQFSWRLIVGVQGNEAELAGQFPPLPNQEYGFDIAVNDWDPGISDDTPQRESQLFWVSPGDGYAQVTSGFGAMRLVEQVTAAPSNPTESSPE